MPGNTDSPRPTAQAGPPGDITPPRSARPRPAPAVLPRYAVAVFTVAAVVAFRLAFWPWLQADIPWIPFALPIIIAAWYGGIGPGLAATALSAVATTYVLLSPYRTLGIHNASEATGLTVFLITGVLMSSLVDRMRAARAALQKRTEELQAANEQLQAQSEEVQAANEELQSQGEELQAQSQDLQAANEELQAQSEEMQATIAELHRTEEALRTSEANYRAIFHASDDGIFVHDLHTGVILDVNERATEMYGYTPDEMRALDVEALSAGVTPYTMEDASAWIARASAGEPQVFEWLAKGKSGSPFWVEVHLKRTTIGHEDRILANVRDIGRRKRAEEMLRETDRRKDEFLAMLAHELRNPLAAMASATDIIRARPADDPLAVRARDIAHRQVWHMARLVDDLLDVARITTGRISLHCEPLDLRAAIHAAVDVARPALAARSHDISLDLPDAPLMVEGDMARLTQVFANLLDNAAKYTPPSGSISLFATQEGPHALVAVRDNGRGIDAAILPQVFGLFVQGERTPDRKEGGLGIGLTMVRRLLDLHQGCVDAHSAGLGKGSQFTVWLPLLEQAQSPAPPAANEPSSTAGPSRVLLVDDNADVAELLALTLEEQGHQVLVANSGQQALDAIPHYRPDLVLLDIGMQGMDGYEVARRLRSNPELIRTPIIALTGYGQEEDRQRAREAGFDHHLTKPVTPQVLASALATFTRRKDDL